MSTVTELSKLNGRTSIITGASGHLGVAICETLAELGSDLILVEKPGSDLSKIVSSIGNNFKVNIEQYFCDLESPSDRATLISSILEKHKELNCLINNAAFVGSSDLSGWSVPFE